MTAVQETAYPRLKAQPSARELDAYTPIEAENAFARKIASGAVARVAILIQLRVFHVLGRLVPIGEVPAPIVDHIVRTTKLRKPDLPEAFAEYDASASRRAHLGRMREFLKVQVLDADGRAWLEPVARTAAQSKHSIPDIVNALLEELVRRSYELPGFTTLDKLAVSAREAVHEGYYRTLSDGLSAKNKGLVDELLASPAGAVHSGWQALKREPKQPTNPEVRRYLLHVQRMQALAAALPPFDLPVAKYKFFHDIARASDAAEMAEFKAAKRYALAMVFIRAQHARTLDYAADLFIKFVRRIEAKAQRKLLEHQLEQSKRTDHLIGTLRDLLNAYQAEGSDQQRLRAIGEAAQPDVPALLADCEEHLAYAGKNYLPFLLAPYSTARSLLLNCLEIMGLKCTSQDTTIERLIAVLIGPLRHPRREFVSLTELGLDATRDLDWLSAAWRRQVFSKAAKTQGGDVVHRKFFELAVLLEVSRQLRSGDVCIPQGERFDDYRNELVDDATLAAELPGYGEVSGIPIDAAKFVAELRTQLIKKAEQVDKRFPKNPYATVEDGRLVLRRLQRPEVSAAIQALDRQISERLPPTKILDILMDVTRGLGLDRLFRPLAGTETRIDDLVPRVVSTLFCYGCNLGPVQTARSIKDLSRRQVAWLNIKYVTEDVLEKAITEVINAYNRFELPRYWGSGKSASADGTQYTVYEGNLFSECHIRYGGYGGIAYFHVSDNYIALVSRFMTSGVHESIHILDPFLENKSDIQFDTVHGDTQAQSYPVFALAHLIGWKLMPRIRHIKDLVLSRPAPGRHYKHIDALFGDKSNDIDWDLIATHFPDIMRVMVSIKLGRLSPSAILRRLGTHSRKNKLYEAFRELGKVIRTLYLLDYIDDVEVRRIVQAATNKSEEWNGFSGWSFFGNDGIIAENVRHEQVKVIKYNHLVANMIALHNVHAMTVVLQKLIAEGATIDAEMLAGLSPYRTSHINLLGDYTLDSSRPSEPLDHERRILRSD